MNQIQRVAVVGAGTMGRGIAQVVAQAGLVVTLIDREPDIVRSALEHIRQQLERAVQRGRLDAEQASVALSLIAVDTGLEAVSDADLVIEAVPEVVDLKRDIFHRLDQYCAQQALLASNTSSISITLLGAATGRPERVLGLHFFNPVPVMKLVEVVRGLRTADETIEAAVQFARRLGKTPVVVKDSPGFVSNRVLMPMINEAVYALMEGVASAEEIDTVMRLGANHPMGPLELADLIGLDVVLQILEVLHHDFGDPKYRPCPFLRQMVAAGKLGRKSGEGFYRYEE
ncbi:putative 3-hydroxybutyryl-CoA dehydrogenase [bacterium HR26]|nr:putative 3-hydroxybutyryl-CoA dehydrogenase [bacterium HR26]